MKKFFSFALAVAAVAMVSCGGNTNKKAAEVQAEEPATECTECTECNKNCEECEKAEGCTCENAEEAPAEEAAPAEETK